MIARLVDVLRARPQVDLESAKAERKRARAAERERLRVARREEEAERRRRRRDAAERAREAQLALAAAAAGAYDTYTRTSPWAERCRRESAAVALTASERRVADALSPLWEATPEMIGSLRRFGQVLTGVSAADYEDGSSELGKRLRRDLKRVYAEVGRDLFVPESPLLGGFGFAGDGARYNADTVMFLNVLVGLHDGGVLGGMRGNVTRQLVWEIGGGWGGFAYQLKSVCPNTTYLITGRPELLLLSAVYLQTVFPDARHRFFGGSNEDLWRDWADVDFMFAPETALPVLRPPHVDLAIDVMAMRDMTSERMEGHVQWAADRGCRYFYSLHPGMFSYEALPAAWRAIATRYWVQPIPPRLEVDKPIEIDYSHLIAWSRLRP